MAPAREVIVTGLILMHLGSLAARPEPPILGPASGSLDTSNGLSSSAGGPGGSIGYSYGPPPPSPSITINSYGSATSEYGPPTQAPIIHKHVYVHVPPPEPEYVTTRKPVVVPPPQKHYKIVFIKAPSPPTPAPPVLPPIQQNEEKTLVYVLVKKQDEPEEIVIPTVAPTPPSKPEVYFIRYKTQRSSAEHGSNGGGPYPESGGPTPPTEYGAPPVPSQSPSNSYAIVMVCGCTVRLCGNVCKEMR
uniref:DUF243 domain-containing protein n=1 Tax=Anopheles maculatus TaxID=74869 RepID=A0A182SJ91_9DIPT